MKLKFIVFCIFVILMGLLFIECPAQGSSSGGGGGGRSGSGDNSPNLISGTLDITFNNSGSGATSQVKTFAKQSDGKILIGGIFSLYNGIARSCIARINSDGSLDTSFDSGAGANGYIHSIALQSDDKIIIAGNITSYNLTSIHYIAILTDNGSIDSSFDPSNGTDDVILCMAVLSDNKDKIIIGGGFTTCNGTSINRIARLNSDGSLDATFNPGAGANNYIRTIKIQPDGKILIGGDFSTYDGVTRYHFARLNSDGSLDTAFDPGNYAFAYGVESIALQSDGKILISCGPQRFNSNGTPDTSFTSGGGVSVASILLQSNGKILIGGYFSTYLGTSINNIARLDSNGLVDTSFDPGTGTDSYISSVFLQTSNLLLIGGEFTSYNGITSNHIARIIVN